MKKLPLPYCMIILSLVSILISPENGFSCKSRTHAFIAPKAGIKNPEYSYFAVLFKEDNKILLGPLHYPNAMSDAIVTPACIDRYPISINDYVPARRTSLKPITIRAD